MKKKVSVMGTGTMGTGIVHMLVVSDYEVVWLAHSSGSVAGAVEGIRKSLDKALGKKVISRDDASMAMGRVSATTDYREMEGSEAIIEAVTESEAMKMEVLKNADRYRGSAIIATNTSSISITRLAAAILDKEAFLGMHFFNPVPVMKPIEMIVTEYTSGETERRALGIADACGKTVIKVKDYPGFVANNILMQMLNEAVVLLEKGVAEKEGIDKIVRLGLNHPMGPLELADFIGLDVCKDISDSIYRATKDERFKTPELINRLVESGKLGRKSGEGFYSYRQRDTYDV